MHVDGMMDSATFVKSELSNLRTTERFAKIFKEAQNMIDSVGFEFINLLRRRKVQDNNNVEKLQNTSTTMLKKTTIGFNFMQRLMLI